VTMLDRSYVLINRKTAMHGLLREDLFKQNVLFVSFNVEIDTK